MSKSEEDRSDPSGGKSGASPSAPGAAAPKNTAESDPTTRQPPEPGAIPQTPPVPDVKAVFDKERRDYERSKK